MEKYSEEIVDAIASVCHDANASYCRSIGDNSQKPWAESETWQKESARNGVRLHLNHPETTPEQSHDSWLEEKRLNGWTYGPVKDVEKKQHPCFMPYSGLPLAQRVKDALFKAVIEALRPAE